MKVSLNWVKEFTDVKLSPDELVEKIGAQLGAIEEVIALGEKYQSIVIAKVITCEKHPNADKLQVCTIDDGGVTSDIKRNKEGHVQVVCGAPNVAAGMLVAWLPPGTTVPSSYDKEPFVLDSREIRGVVSNGMLASAHELALSDDHSGIAELSYGQVGGDFAEEFGLNDYILDIENKMFTHRPDLFGILGVAREIAGITGQRFKSPEWYMDLPGNEQKAKNDKGLSLEVKNTIPALVPRFMAQVIEGVDVKSSPVWMQAYLSRVGIRPINNVVDVTNYAMHLTAQPLHAYDYDKLCKVAGTKTAQLETRLSKKGDKLNLLNGKSITFDNNEIILITSNDIPVGIGGVMGGADTEVDENTKNIVLECANFDMYTIRRASMRCGLFTDAVTRFNKGQSPLQNPAVLQKTTDWTVELAGGRYGKVIDNHQKLQKPIAVHVTAEFINARLGLKLSIKEMAQLLTNVELDVAINGPTLVVTAPFWRTDIEISEDVVEEIGRLYGYDHLPLELPKRSLAPVKIDELIKLKDRIRQILSAAGANEILSYSFVHGDLLDKVGQDRKHAFQLSNALSPDLQYYRLSLTPSLLDKIHPNIKAGYGEFAVFEIGKVHIKGQEEDGLPKELERLAVVYAANKKSAGAAYYEARAYLMALFKELGMANQTAFKPLNDKKTGFDTEYYSPARAALVTLDGKMVGQIGEYNMKVASALKLPAYCAGFELDLKAIAEIEPAVHYKSLSRFPGVEQDISLKVPAELTYGELYSFIDQKMAELKPRETAVIIEPLDIYQRENDKKHKQITLRIGIASYERTLTDQEVNKLLDDVAQAAHEKLSAQRL